MLAMQQIVGQLSSPIEQLISFVQSFQDAKISLERLNEIHTLEDEEPFSHPIAKVLPDSGDLHLKNVSFQWG